MKLNWKKIWEEYEKWYMSCPGKVVGIEAQKRAVKRIVNKEFDSLECPQCGCEFMYYKNRG